jgi:hypothetical protein
MLILSTVVVIYLVAACGFSWIATKVRGSKLSWVFSFLMAGCAAYALGFASSIVVLRIIRYPEIELLPVDTWTVGGLTCLAVAGTAQRSGWVNAIPSWVLGAILLYAFVAMTEPAFLWVACFLFVTGFAVLYVMPRAKLDTLDPWHAVVWPVAVIGYPMYAVMPVYLYGLYDLLRAGEILKAIGAGAIIPVGVIYGMGRYLGWW